MLNKCRSDLPKYGSDSIKIDSVTACFVGGRKKLSYRLQAAAYRTQNLTAGGLLSR